ncbi:MAG: zinc-binding dehydrogenase [Acidimicrobiales bacterium]
MDRHQSRLDLATRFGATATLSGDPTTFAAQMQELTGGGTDYAFDTTGNAAVVRSLYEGMNNLGTLGMAGVGFGDITFDFLSMIGGRTITGVMEGDSTRASSSSIGRAECGRRLPFDELITTFAIDQINDAEAASASGEVIKPVLLF